MRYIKTLENSHRYRTMPNSINLNWSGIKVYAGLWCLPVLPLSANSMTQRKLTTINYLKQITFAMCRSRSSDKLHYRVLLLFSQWTCVRKVERASACFIAHKRKWKKCVFSRSNELETWMLKVVSVVKDQTRYAVQWCQRRIKPRYLRLGKQP